MGSILPRRQPELTDGAEDQGLDYYRENGFRTKEFPKEKWYLYPAMVAQDLRFELPYQERLLRIGQELGARLHEQGITWWDRQLKEYEALPHWQDLQGLWETALETHYDVKIADYPFWLLTSRFLNVFLNSRTSWMSREALAGLPFFALGGAFLLWPVPLTGLLAVASGMAFVYCQGRILRAAKGIPAWRQPGIVPLIMTTGLTEGVSLFAIVAVLAGYAALMLQTVGLALLVLVALRWARQARRSRR